MKKYDNFRLGFFVGLLAPIITFFVIYFVKKDVASFQEYLNTIVSHQLFTKLLSLSALPNLVFFFLFINTSRYRSTQGVLGATFLLAFVMLLLKMIL